MSNRTIQLIRWTPRILGILFVLFISIFAADAFGQGHSFWQTLVDLSMHLLPSFVLLAAVVLAWRWPWVGTLAFWGFAIQYLIVFGGSFPWSVYVLLMGLPILIGLLFLMDWFMEPRQSATVS